MFANEHQHKFDELIKASPSATAIYHTRDIVITAANEQMLAFWGKDESILGKPMAEGIPELIGQPFIGFLQQVYDTGITHHAEHDSAQLIINGELQTFYFNYTYRPILGTDGKTEAIIHSAIDVTALVKAQQELSETRERLSLALESGEIGIWELNPISREVHWDLRCRQLFGFEGESDIPYEQVLDCIHPDDKKKVIDAVDSAVDPNQLANYDVRYRTVSNNSGILRWVHCKGRAYLNTNGATFRFAGTARDITNEVNTSLSEQQLLSLVSYNADHMSIADMQGNLIYMNASGRNLLGVPLDININKLTASDFYEPEELQRVQQQIIPKISDLTGWTGILYLRHYTTKETIPCQVNYILVKNPITGELIGRGATARDLRPELKARTELQRLATIVEFSEDFCNYTDLKGNTVYINASGQRLIGIKAEQLSGIPTTTYHSQASNVEMENNIRKQLLSEGRWSGTIELKHLQTGEIIPIHKQLFLIRDELSAEPIAIAGIARDLRAEISSQQAMKIKNSELARAVKELEFLANSVPAVVWTATADGLLDFINQRWLERSNVPISQALGNKWTSTLHPDDVQPTLEAWQKSLDNGSLYEVEFRLMDKLGTYRWWLVRAIPLIEENGNVIKWYGSNTEITEQKELERQKDNFLGVASHELKTPVTSIKAYAQVVEMMLKRSGDEKNLELIGKMNRQINRLTALISDLLDVTKINTGKLTFSEESFDFDKLIEEVSEEVQLTSEHHQIERKLYFGEQINGDRERIRQVVVNLLTNAIKYSPQAERVVIHTKKLAEEVQCCIQDFGIGLAPDKHEKIFEQFYRISGIKEYTFPGLGLGLYISSEIVKQMGGRIWVNSKLGEGATFCFAIPLKT